MVTGGAVMGGAAYLLVLAWKTLKPGGASLFERRELPRDSRWKLLRTGLVTNLLNPKAAIKYLALIPQFVDQSAVNVVAQGFILGGVQISVSTVVNSIIVLRAGAIFGLPALASGLAQVAALDHRITGSLDHWITGSLDHWITGSLDHRIAPRTRGDQARPRRPVRRLNLFVASNAGVSAAHPSPQSHNS
jgi:LysE type translocator